MNAPIKIDIRKQAKKSIDRADDTTVKMILAMLAVQEKEAEEEETEFEKEMLRRFDDYEKGRIVPLSLDELEKRVRANHKKTQSTSK